VNICGYAMRNESEAGPAACCSAKGTATTSFSLHSPMSTFSTLTSSGLFPSKSTTAAFFAAAARTCMAGAAAHGGKLWRRWRRRAGTPVHYEQTVREEIMVHRGGLAFITVRE